MRINPSSASAAGSRVTSRVVTTLAAFGLAVPMVIAFGGTAVASDQPSDRGSRDAAPGQLKKAADAAAVAPVVTVTAPAPLVTVTAPAPVVTVTAPVGTADTSKANTSTAGASTQPQPLSNADMNASGANNGGACGAYCSTRDGSPSLNGSGGGAAGGRPCAGCVGKADNKNPSGQAPDGTDHNNGYECDGNSGVGKTNPAHTGCKTPLTTCVPKTGQDSSCKPIVQCVPKAGQDSNCKPIEKVCPPAGTVGPVLAGCPFSGGGGGPGTTIVPRTNTPGVTVVPPTPVEGTTPGPGTSLPFTGDSTSMLANSAALMLLVGTFLVVATRKPKPALALG